MLDFDTMQKIVCWRPIDRANAARVGGSALTRLLVVVLLILGGLVACNSSEDKANGEQEGRGQTFHVSPDGDDGNEGSEAKPWQNLQFASDQLQPGDTLLVHAGSYPAPLVVNAQGSEDGGMITIRSAEGEAVLIDASDTEIGKGFYGLVQIRNGRYVRVEGFEIANGSTEKSRRNPVGIFVSGSGSHIELVNNDIHHIASLSTTGQRDAHGIAVYGTSETPITDVLVANNKVHDLTLGTSEAVVINGNVDGFVVENNEVFDNDNIGIDIIGFEGKAPVPELDRARNGIVRNNLVYNIDTGDNPVYTERNAGGIYVDGGSDVLIENNVVHHSNMGIEIASEAKSGDTSRIIVRNNRFYANHLTGLAMGGYDENRGRTEGCEVAGNRFEGNDTDQVGWGELVIQFDVRDNTVTNNVFIAGPSGRFISNAWQENAGSVFNDNTYVSTGDTFWEWQQVEYESFADYQQGTGNDSDSVFRTSE